MLALAAWSCAEAVPAAARLARRHAAIAIIRFMMILLLRRHLNSPLSSSRGARLGFVSIDLRGKFFFPNVQLPYVYACFVPIWRGQERGGSRLCFNIDSQRDRLSRYKCGP